MSRKKHLAIIGAGPGGYAAALHAAQQGADVTLIEKEKLGGVCLNWGCIPSKIMQHTAALLRKMQQASAYGILTAGCSVDLGRLRQRQEAVITNLRQGMAGQLSKAGVRQMAGTASISGSGALEVRTATGSSRLAWDKLIIATGSVPLEIKALPFDGQQILSSSDILSVGTLPESLVIVGGGVIGCEFAFILQALGVRVTVVEGLSRLLPLPAVDHECSKVLARQMKKAGIRVLLETMVQGRRQTAGGQEIVLRLASGKHAGEELSAAAALVCVGRQPALADLGLGTVGVEIDRHGWIVVDDELRTSHPDICAIGDVLGPVRPMLAHVASREGLLAAANCLGKSEHMAYGAVPSAIFTDPEVGCVGLSEQEAVAKGLAIKLKSMQFRACGKAQVIDEIEGLVKIVAEEQTGKILGVHIVGPHASDLLGEAVLALTKNCTLAELAGAIHAHPTLAEMLMETAQL